MEARTIIDRLRLVGSSLCRRMLTIPVTAEQMAASKEITDLLQANGLHVPESYEKTVVTKDTPITFAHVVRYAIGLYNYKPAHTVWNKLELEGLYKHDEAFDNICNVFAVSPFQYLVGVSWEEGRRTIEFNPRGLEVVRVILQGTRNREYDRVWGNVLARANLGLGIRVTKKPREEIDDEFIKTKWTDLREIADDAAELCKRGRGEP